jgi:hypothetical protein
MAICDNLLSMIPLVHIMVPGYLQHNVYGVMYYKTENRRTPTKEF